MYRVKTAAIRTYFFVLTFFCTYKKEKNVIFVLNRNPILVVRSCDNMRDIFISLQTLSNRLPCPMIDGTETHYLFASLLCQLPYLVIIYRTNDRGNAKITSSWVKRETSPGINIFQLSILRKNSSISSNAFSSSSTDLHLPFDWHKRAVKDCGKSKTAVLLHKRVRERFCEFSRRNLLHFPIRRDLFRNLSWNRNTTGKRLVLILECENCSCATRETLAMSSFFQAG